MKGHPLHIQSRGKRCPSLAFFHKQMATFYCRTHQQQKLTPRSIEIFFGVCLLAYKGGLAAAPPVATPAGISHPGGSSPGTAASQHVQQLFEGGIKARCKSLQPEAREECFHETSIGYEALGVQTAIKEKAESKALTKHRKPHVYFFSRSPASSKAAAQVLVSLPSCQAFRLAPAADLPFMRGR